jgi:hypothetical protein
VNCDYCGEPLPAPSRRNKRYCDARCRRRAFEERRAPDLEPVAPLATEAVGPVPAIRIADDRQAEELLARVIAEPRLVALVAAASKTNWRAAAFLLERHYPERWAPVRRPQAEPELPGVDENDPFAEVDALAARRRARQLIPE